MSVANLRGGVICVFDLVSFLRSGEATHDAKSMLVVHDPTGRRLGVLSESLPDFQRVQAGETMAAPTSEGDIYLGTVERSGDLLGVIETTKLFDALQRRLGEV